MTTRECSQRGIGAIVHDGVNGCLTRSGEAGAMSQAIGRILTDARIAGAMSVASRRLAERQAHFETIDQYERMYDMLAGGSQQSPCLRQAAMSACMIGLPQSCTDDQSLRVCRWPRRSGNGSGTHHIVDKDIKT